MVLAAVLADRDRTWLATEQDKLTYFTQTHRIPRLDLPSLTFRAEDAETVRYFPDKLPIALDADGRTHVFLYLLTQDLPIDFRGFLERLAELLRALPAWTVRRLVPCHKRDAMPRYEAAFYEQLASPLRPSLLEDVRWYFHAPQPVEGARTSDSIRPSAPSARLAFKRCIARGWNVVNRSWTPPCRRRLADAIARKTGRLECHVLPHRYGHLFPLVGTA